MRRNTFGGPITWKDSTAENWKTWLGISGSIMFLGKFDWCLKHSKRRFPQRFTCLSIWNTVPGGCFRFSSWRYVYLCIYYMYTCDASYPNPLWSRPNIPWVLHVLRKKHRINPNPMAGDVSRVSLHVWESFMEKTGTGDPVGNNIHPENEADGSVLREGPGYPMTHPWDWYIYLHEWQIFMVHVGKYIQ